MEGAPENRDVLVAELIELRRRMTKSDPFGFNDKVIEKSEELNEKYPDALYYELYHVLIGSTPPEYVNKFEFPGDDSVEKFFRSLE